MTEHNPMRLDFADVQRRFARGLLAGDENATDAATAVADIQAGKLSADARLDIYRHNVHSVLGNALRDLYPAAANVVGGEFFTEAARQFVQSTPSTSGDLNDFGSTFAEFLATYPHSADLPYLPDLARLEWAWHRAFHAADEAPMDLAALGAEAPEALGDVVFGLHPSASLLRSAYPLVRIWQVNQPGYVGSWEVEWDVPETYVLVFRHEYEVAVQSLDAAQHAMLHHVFASAPLETVLNEIQKINSAFDLQGFLAHCVQLHIINKFWTPT